MKFSLVALSALVAAVAAQDINSLSACGQLCVNNMVAAAQKDFKCAAGDIKCYCANPGFALGLRDCSAQACGTDVSSQVVAYGNAYCASAGGSTTTGGTSVGTATGTATSAASAASGSVSSAEASGSSALSGASASASSAAAAASNSANSALSSASSSISGAVASATSKAASSASSATGSSSSSAGAGAAIRTAAPLAGAFGMAALLLV